MVSAISSNNLLVVWHSRTGASEGMARAAAEASNAILMAAEDVTERNALSAGGYLFVCPENLASMSGTMKEMFDRLYYPLLGQVEGRPYASIIAAGSDGQGAQRQLDRIATGWRLRRIADPVIFNFDAQTPERILADKVIPDNILKDCWDLGNGFAEGIAMGVF